MSKNRFAEMRADSRTNQLQNPVGVKGTAVFSKWDTFSYGGGGAGKIKLSVQKSTNYSSRLSSGTVLKLA